MVHQYAIVTGQGRSGTNWVLDILDASRETICKNEPNVVNGSPFGKLTPLWLMAGGRRELDREWDSIAEETCTTISDRDHRLTVNKHYLHSWAHKLGLPSLMARPRIRAVLARTVVPSLAGNIWRMPRAVGNPADLEEAYGIIKVNRVPLLVDWVLRNRTNVPVVNIIRHPCGRHASYANRFLASRDGAEELEQTKKTLRRIADADPEWAAKFRSIDPMGIDSMGHAGSQTWLWRFVNETIEISGAQNPRYKRIVYEEMVADPIPFARSVYQLMGLEWTEEVASHVGGGLNDSVWGSLDSGEVADRWRKQLGDADQEEIQNILATSPLAGLWS